MLIIFHYKSNNSDKVVFKALANRLAVDIDGNKIYPADNELEDKQKVDITQLIYARSYRGM